MKHLINSLVVGTALLAQSAQALDERVRGAQDAPSATEITTMRTSKSGKRYQVHYQLLSRDSKDITIEDGDLDKLDSAKALIRVDLTRTEGAECDCGEDKLGSRVYTSQTEQLLSGAHSLQNYVDGMIADVEKTAAKPEGKDKKTANQRNKKGIEDDPEYAELACLDSENSYAESRCLLGNLSAIKAKIKEDSRYSSLYTAARRKITAEATEMFNIEDISGKCYRVPKEVQAALADSSEKPTNPCEVKASLAYFTKMAAESKDTTLLEDIRGIQRYMQIATNNRATANLIRTKFENEYQADLTQAIDDMNYGRDTRNQALETAARERYNRILPYVQSQLAALEKLSPDDEITSLSRYTDPSNADFLQAYFTEARDAMAISIGMAANPRSGDGYSTTLPVENRGRGYTRYNAMTSYDPNFYSQPYNFYNNSQVDSNDPMANFYNGSNSLLNNDPAVRYMNQNGVPQGSRGREAASAAQQPYTQY